MTITRAMEELHDLAEITDDARIRQLAIVLENALAALMARVRALETKVNRS